jgi:hypothetical protein
MLVIHVIITIAPRASNKYDFPAEARDAKRNNALSVHSTRALNLLSGETKVAEILGGAIAYRSFDPISPTRACERVESVGSESDRKAQPSFVTRCEKLGLRRLHVTERG